MNLPPANREQPGRDSNASASNNLQHPGSHGHPGNHGHREELGGLLEAVCEDRLTSAQHARLEQLLLADADARAYYLNYIDLHGALYWDLAVAEQTEDDEVAALVDATILRLAQPDSDAVSRRGGSQTDLVPAKQDRFAKSLDSFSTLTRSTLTASAWLKRSWSKRTWLRQTGMMAAGCVILGLGVWIGNQTAKPGQVAGIVSQDAAGNNPQNGSTAAAIDRAQADRAQADRAQALSQFARAVVTSTAEPVKFGSDDVRLPAGPQVQQGSISTPDVTGSHIASNGASDQSNSDTTETIHSESNHAERQSDSSIKNSQRASAGSTAASSGAILAYINEQLKSEWSRAEISPSAKADDAEWQRRLHLDLLGHIPSVVDFEKFQADRSPSKRAAEIDRLLDSPAFARNFATIWTNLLVGRVPREEVNRVALATFLRQKFGRNRPWHEIVFDLVAAEGRTDQNGAANFLVAHLNGGAIPATGITSRLFLGAQLQCAQCHNHPFSNSKQEQFWAFNSFFQQAVVVRVPRYDAKTGRMIVAGIELATKDGDEPRYYETRNGLMKVAYPAFGSTKIDHTQITNRRRELARLMTSSEDSSLAPAFVNRMWAHFHGRSFTPVVDDMGPHVAPSHPQLLDRLSEEFMHSGYDIKQLVRWICNSDGYQLTSRFNESNSKDNPETGEPPLFSHMYVKPMSPEQLYDSLVVATQGQLAGGPTLDQSDKTRDAWLRQFVVSFETEENDETSTLDGSITQSLLMMNGDLVQGATAVQSGTWLHKLLASKSSEADRIQAIFISALSRPASAKELSTVKKLLKNGTGHGKNVSLEQAYQDIYWALLNSNEFILNH